MWHCSGFVQRSSNKLRWTWRPTNSPRTVWGGYRYNHAVTFVKNIEGVLDYEFFEAAKDGMKGLFSDAANDLTRFKANVAITKADVKKRH